MKPHEVIAAQKRIGCTNAKLAEWLGVSQVSVSHWRTGKRNISGPAALAIKALASGWRP